MGIMSAVLRYAEQIPQTAMNTAPVVGPLRQIPGEIAGVVNSGPGQWVGSNVVAPAFDWTRTNVEQPVAGWVGQAFDEPSDPLVRAAGSPVGRAAITALSYTDMPRKAGTVVAGQANYRYNELMHALGAESDADWARIQQEAGNGNLISQGRNIWEHHIVNDLPMWQRAALDIGVDPLTWASLGTGSALEQGLVNTGRGLRLAEDASLGARAAGFGLEGAGRAAGSGERALNLINKAQDVALKGVAKPITFTSSRTLGKIPKVKALLELSKEGATKAETDYLWSHGADFLARETDHPEMTAAGQTGKYGTQTVQAIRNAQYSSAPIQSTLAAGDRAKSILGIVDTPDTRGALGFIPSVGTPERVNVNGSSVTRWTGEAQRNAATDYAASLLISEAPLQTEYDGLRGAMEGVQRFGQRLVADLGPEYEPLVPEIYDRVVRQVSAPGAELPAPTFAGSNPLGGGSITQNPTDQDLIRHGVAWAAAQMQLSREGGAARQFLPGGAYHTASTRSMPADLRDLFTNGGVGEEGLSILSKDQFADVWRQHVGAANATQADIDLYYKRGLDQFYQRMREAVLPIMQETDKRAPVQVGMLPNRQELTAAVQSPTGQTGMGFYEGDFAKLRAVFPSDQDTDLFLKFMAAGSPRNGVTQNTTDAMRHYVDYKANNWQALRDAGFSEEELQQLGRPTAGLQDDMDTRRALFQQVVRGEPLEQQKVGSFYSNYREAQRADLLRSAYGAGTPEQQGMLDSVLASERATANASTIDSHHLRQMGLGDAPTNPTYQMQEQVVNTLAHELGLAPREVQAAVWLVSKENQGFKELDQPIQTQVLNRIAGTDFRTVDPITGEVKVRPAQTMAETFPQATHDQVWAWYQEATKAAQTAVTASSYHGGHVLIRPELTLPEGTRRGIEDKAVALSKEANPTGWKEARWRGNREEGWTTEGPGGKLVKASPDRKLKKSDMDPLAGQDGVVLASMTVDSQDSDQVAHAIVKFKLGMQDAFDQDWQRFRIAVNSDTPDGSTKISALYFPNHQSGPVLDHLTQMADDAFTAAGGDWNVQRGSVGVTTKAMMLADRAFDTSGGWQGFVKSDDLKETLTKGLTALQHGESDGSTYDLILSRTGKTQNVRIRPLTDLPKNPDGTPQKMVPLTSAGVTGTIAPDPSSIPAIQQFLARMQPIMGSREAGLIKFGLFKSDAGTASFDLVLPAINPREADELASLTNQISYYDPDMPDPFVTPSGGLHNSDSPFKTPEQVAALLDAVTRSRRNGTTIAEELQKEPVHAPWSPQPAGILAAAPTPSKSGILARAVQALTTPPGAGAHAALTQVLGPDRMRAITKRFGPRTSADLLGTDAAQNAMKFDVAAIHDLPAGHRPWLSEETNHAMFDQELGDTGQTVGKFLYSMRARASVVKQKLDANGISWDNAMDPDTWHTLTNDPTLKDDLKFFAKMDLDPLHQTPDQLALSAMQYKVAEAHGLDVAHRSTYRLLKQAWAENALASPRYQTANIMSNTMDAIISGHGMAALMGNQQLAQHVSAELKGGGIGHIANSHLAEFLTDNGFGAPREVLSAGHRNLVGAHGRRSAIRSLAEKVVGPKYGWIGKPFEANAAIAQGIDNSFRAAVFQDVSESHFEEHAGELYGKLTAAAQKGGLDATAQGVDLLPTKDPSALYRYYRGLGVKDEYAKRMSRDVAELQNSAKRAGLDETSRIYLTYNKTNLDEMVGKVIPFHYWASRKVRFYGEEAFRNPALIANWYRINNGIERAQQDPGLSARQKGFLRLAGGPTGFTLMMNPDALLGVIRASGIGQQYTPDGQTELGGIMSWLKRNGIGLYPWLDSVANLAGVYGNTFEPDVLGIRQKALVSASVNWMRAEGLMGDSNENPGAAPYDTAMGEARAEVSKWTSTFLPDWISQPVPMEAGGTTQEVSLDKVIENRIMAENPSLTNGDLATIMNNPDDPRYQSAFKDAARAGVITQLLSFTLPTSFKERENSADVRTATNNLVKAQAKKLGVNPEDVTPTMADAQFKATYKAQTGKEFEAGDWADADLKRQLTFATPQGRQFIIQENAYQQIGSPAAKQLQQTYYQILDGTAQIPGVNLLSMDSASRTFVAKQWLHNQPGSADLQQMYDLQDQFRQTHPQFAEFKQWQSQIANVRDLYGGSLAEYRRLVSAQNPNAAAYFQGQIQYLRQSGVPQDQWAQRLDQATMSSNLWFLTRAQAQSAYDPKPAQNTNDPALAMAPPDQTQYPQQPSQPQWGSGYNPNTLPKFGV